MFSVWYSGLEMIEDFHKETLSLMRNKQAINRVPHTFIILTYRFLLPFSLKFSFKSNRTLFLLAIKCDRSCTLGRWQALKVQKSTFQLSNAFFIPTTVNWEYSYFIFFGNVCNTQKEVIYTL